MKQTIEENLTIPEGITVTVEQGLISVKGPKGEVQRDFRDPGVSISSKEGSIVFHSKDATRREKKRLYTYRAHVRNMLRGVQEGHTYQVKICSGHFPMNVSVQNGKMVVKNFLGEKFPRELKLIEGVQIKQDGDTITLTGCNKEKVGQCAADMEQLTRITNRDRRIFQDGLYIIMKDGVEIQ